MTLLSVSGLAVARGGLRTLENLNFTLEPGQALILRGPNGLGKTTLLRTLAGLQPAVDGQIAADPDSTAYAAHADGLKSALTVTENLRFWAEVFGGSGIDQALSLMNLTELAARPAHALSAGQKRRLGLARLMVTGRAVWLMDEPTVSLDAASVGLFVQMVRAHLAAGGGAVIATHIDLGLAEARVLDLTPFKAAPTRSGNGTGRAAGFNEAFG